MAKHRARTPEPRWVVVCDRYSESAGDFIRDEFPILYGTFEEANDTMHRLNEPTTADQSYFIPGETDGHLFVEQIFIG